MGIYFGDVVTKSLAYCRPKTSNNEALLLLCDVAVANYTVFQSWGHVNDVTPSLTPKSSTKACGITAPDEFQVHML
ncbi:hypothetical protein BV898_09060 [Hypsibius exemplaris]|uniref:Poly [ADP-ribose] polymerase n=1 Tax=Hypsibius exemplaris TaxID=2072580 RepID=A0A1W0WNZ0_HYPEX|nr:hypothetical protein BV898_09060 [Hypsibius exemplaris]